MHRSGKHAINSKLSIGNHGQFVNTSRIVVRMRSTLSPAGVSDETGRTPALTGALPMLFPAGQEAGGVQYTVCSREDSVGMYDAVTHLPFSTVSLTVSNCLYEGFCIFESCGSAPSARDFTALPTIRLDK